MWSCCDGSGNGGDNNSSGTNGTYVMGQPDPPPRFGDGLYVYIFVVKWTCPTCARTIVLNTSSKQAGIIGWGILE